MLRYSRAMKRAVLALSLVVIAVSPASSQLSDQPEGPAEDEVIVEGTIRGADPAMSAWLAGDYVTAEIEFEKNFSRLKRIESAKRSAIEQNASDAIQGQIMAGANTDSGSSAESTSGGVEPTSTTAQVYTNQRFRPGDEDPNTIGSGNDLGGQLYMAGMSELRLGKLDEAKESFDRALFYNQTLHDARLRRGLLAVAEGDMSEARRQLERLQRELDGCHSRCDRLGDRDILKNAVEELSPFVRDS